MRWLIEHVTRYIKRNERVDIDALDRKAEESIEQTVANQPKVNAVTSWLERRQNQNGFGEDFEYTLRPKEAR